MGVRHRQELRFATSEWHKRYATLHNRLMAILDAVAEAPPPQFSGGGQWEAMHGDMGGYYEILHKAQSGSSFDFSAFLRMQA